MAVPGLSGSTGGVSPNNQYISKEDLNIISIQEKYAYPIDISYFVNNTCNLRCKHCYVAYGNSNNALDFSEWQNVFAQCIDLGARTFGNVGKEPTLSWPLTKKLLMYFKDKRILISDLRYGLVTNGTLLNKSKVSDLVECLPNYIDISLDGNKKTHDLIRGKGAFDKLIHNLKIVAETCLLSKIFIIYTINKATINAISEVLDIITDIGIQNILFSPYVTLNKNDELYLSDNQLCSLVGQIMENKIIDFKKYRNITIYLKNDYSTTLGTMNKLVEAKIIDLEKLHVDEYGVIFNKYNISNNTIIFNYVPFDNSYKQMIRFSHNGYVSNCYDMFFENYPERAIGNVREKSIREILEKRNVFKKEYAGCDFP
ncbi:MAG: hypothetical protein CV087_17700 [Candidatus Brocadia sp. WS118]|nr:MAG: hypothetical protein CV087_17700 [Candidatus Brocadia sp. WS118]